MESQGAALVHSGEGEKLYRRGYFGSVAGCQIEAAQPGGHACAIRPIVKQKRATAMGWKADWQLLLQKATDWTSY